MVIPLKMCISKLLSMIRIVKAFVLVVVGLITIIVGAFMLRGNMHMWDRGKSSTDREK